MPRKRTEKLRRLYRHLRKAIREDGWRVKVDRDGGIRLKHPGSMSSYQDTPLTCGLFMYTGWIVAPSKAPLIALGKHYLGWHDVENVEIAGYFRPIDTMSGLSPLEVSLLETPLTRRVAAIRRRILKALGLQERP